jgi:xanthine dehydrogenase YagS FAD-binding subunit
MQNFSLTRPADRNAAIMAAQMQGAAYIAGGTDMMQLLRNNVVAPTRLVDLETFQLSAITVTNGDLRLGALTSMADVAAHPAVVRYWPVISEALLRSASPQIRNMGTMGGNLLQRTRCLYFRDTGFACNKRLPGSGCPAIEGDSRDLAIFGTSAHCIATHPSDLPVALMALGASVETEGAQGGKRILPLAEFYRRPGDTPHLETNLQPGELIVAIVVPGGEVARRSAYLKVRDRSSFAFALVSAAVGLDIQGGTIRDARLALGGVGVMPWRLPTVEAALRGQAPTEAVFQAAAAQAGTGAQTTEMNAFKVILAQRTVLRALQTVAA